MDEVRQDDLPLVAAPKPFYVELRRGRPIAWCRCGRSRRQPYCDGRSHLGTGFEPLIYRASHDEEVLLCGCKQTGTPPFCDGTHNNLPGGYRSDERSDEERERIPLVEADSQGVQWLDEACYVVTPAASRPALATPFWMRTIIGPQTGALHQSQVYIEMLGGISPILSGGASDVVLWISSGRATITISGRDFEIATGAGVYIRPNEAFLLKHAGGAPLRVFASICPGRESFVEFDAMTRNFDENQPQRVRTVDETQRAEMGPRYFQMLIDNSFGLNTAAQFIGHIPVSRAEMHKHLYEEALIIQSGEGMVWNESSRARIRAGDVLFLPRKHAHMLECVDPAGMDVVGIIHPGDNPSINY